MRENLVQQMDLLSNGIIRFSTFFFIYIFDTFQKKEFSTLILLLISEYRAKLATRRHSTSHVSLPNVWTSQCRALSHSQSRSEQPSSYHVYIEYATSAALSWNAAWRTQVVHCSGMKLCAIFLDQNHPKNLQIWKEDKLVFIKYLDYIKSHFWIKSVCQKSLINCV